MAISDLTQEQREAVETVNKPTLVYAGAGAGKTRVLVEKYLKLLESGLTPSTILCLTFTTDSADEMKSRLTGRLVEQHPDLTEKIENTANIGTIHSFCYQVLNQYASELGLPKVKEILDPFTFATQFEKKYALFLNTLDSEKLVEILQYYPHTQLHGCVLELYEKRHGIRKEERGDSVVLNLLLDTFLPLVNSLEEDFYKRGLYSFDDLEALAIRILDEVPLAKPKLMEQYKAVLIDEFQDVSRSQWKLLREIALSNPGGLFLVGDPKQSIYGFRNSEPELFYETSNRLSASGSKVVELTWNFRTHGKLLGQLNRFSSALFTDIDFKHMQAGDSAEYEKECFHLNTFDCTEEHTRGELQAIEMEEIVRSIARLIHDGAEPTSIALLFRNADRMVEYRRSLEKRDIPASLTHSLSFSSSYEILDLIAYLKSCLNPLDNASLAHFLRSPYFSISLQELADLGNAPETSLFEKLLQSTEPKLASKLTWFFQLIESGQTNTEKLLDALFQNSKYFPKSPEALLLFLKAKEKSGNSLLDFVSNIETWKAHTLFTKVESFRNDAVKLMTVHAAKGLEFDHVFLCDNLRQAPVSSPYLFTRPGQGVGLRYRENGEIVKTPTYEKLYEIQKQREYAESNRVLYVALTRPRKTLSLFLPKNAKKLPSGSWAKMLSEMTGEATPTI